MQSIDVVLREYGQKRDFKALQEFVANTAVEEFTRMVKQKLYHPTFPPTFNYLMQSFQDDDESHDKRFEIVTAVLKEIETGDMQCSQISVLLSRICMELMKFKTEHLVRICSLCIEFIQKGNGTNLSWKDLLPEILNVLIERELVENNGLEMSGLDYKKQVIESLCLMEWSANILTVMVSMFIDMPLTKDEHLSVVNKLTNSLEKLTPQEVPAFVYQMLKLCKHQNSRGLFLRLQAYFANKVYSRLSTPESESMELEIIENSADQNAQQAEATVIYHIYQAACLGHESVKEFLTALKNITKSPESVLNPFLLGVLFSISTIDSYQEKVFDLIKYCTSRAFQEEDRKTDSYWIREIVPQNIKIDLLISQVIDVSVAERDLVVEGLVNFSFALLGIGSALGRDSIAEKQWKLGIKILLKLVKRRRQIAPVILKTLENRIVTGQNVNQYIECVYLLSKIMPLSMIENLNCVVELMDALMQLPTTAGNDLLDAIIPLTKISPTIRNHLIILLRKALYSTTTETRQLAVSGFLKLVTNLKISNLAALSQSSSSSGSFSSGRSIFTQISLNQTSQQGGNGSSNEALCLEVLSILKRCFMQQAEVRCQFYKELHSAVCMNPELGIPILDALWNHFSDYYVNDEEVLPPLQFDNIHLVKDPDIVLKEPLGNLIFTVGLIVAKMAEQDDSNPTVKRFLTVLDSLTTRMINCELIHLGLDDGTDLLDTVPESQKKMIVLKQAILIYEALIGYQIYIWGPNSQNCGQQINNLFQGFLRLIHFSRNIAKPKKAEAKKRKANDETTQQMDSTIKKDNWQKLAKNFKLPNTLLDFKIITKILNLLHRPEIEWTTPAQSSIIKTKLEIHRYVAQAANDLVLSYKNVKILDKQRAKELYDYFVEIAVVLYERCLARMVEFVDFDSTTAVLVAECFYNILLHVNTHFKNNLNLFLSSISKTDKSDPLETHLTPFIQTFKDIFCFENEEIGSEDTDIKKLSTIAINTLTLFANQIPTVGSVLSVELFEWLKDTVNAKMVCNKNAASGVVALLLEMHYKQKPGVQLLEIFALRLGNVMGTINEEEQQSDELNLINEALACTSFHSVCSCIKSMLEDVDWVINRLKAEHYFSNYLGADCSNKRIERIKTKERDVNCQLCLLISVLVGMSNVTIQPGGNCELLLKCLALLYNIVNSLTKYYITVSSKINLAFEGTRFERVVKMIGKHLSPVVYKLFIYIEECQKEANENTQSNRKKTVNTSAMRTKVLRETRTIPKVVYEMEQFSKSMIQLSNKTKVDLAKHLGQGTTRDFRIVNLKEVLENQGGGNVSQAVSSQSSTNNTTETQVDEEMEVDGENGRDEDGSDEEIPSKRVKT